MGLGGAFGGVWINDCPCGDHASDHQSAILEWWIGRYPGSDCGQSGNQFQFLVVRDECNPVFDRDGERQRRCDPIHSRVRNQREFDLHRIVRSEWGIVRRSIRTIDIQFTAFSGIGNSGWNHLGCQRRKNKTLPWLGCKTGLVSSVLLFCGFVVLFLCKWNHDGFHAGIRRIVLSDLSHGKLDPRFGAIQRDPGRFRFVIR